jgi:hypothetical protein
MAFSLREGRQTPAGGPQEIVTSGPRGTRPSILHAASSPTTGLF